MRLLSSVRKERRPARLFALGDLLLWAAFDGAKGCHDAVASAEAVERAALLAAAEGRSRYLGALMARQGDVTASDVSHGARLGGALWAELLSRSGRV